MSGETKKQVKVAILTPYLYESLQDMQDTFDGDMGEVFAQTMFYGFDPDNLNGVKKIETPNHVVTLSTLEDVGMDFSRGALGQDFVIAGSTETSESKILALKQDASGILIARYSIFYGGDSRYTGRSPEATGYALDIPKHPKAIKLMLAFDPFLEAIVNREASAIKDALNQMNQAFPQPVLATPYLEKALEAAT